MDKLWNKCDICGKIIAMKDFDAGKAIRNFIEPDSHFGHEKYETYHFKCQPDKSPMDEPDFNVGWIE